MNRVKLSTLVCNFNFIFSVSTGCVLTNVNPPVPAMLFLPGAGGIAEKQVHDNKYTGHTD